MLFLPSAALNSSIEAGLDYTIQNFNSTSVKVYARGGMELWNSDRGTTWRGSGGVTFQF